MPEGLLAGLAVFSGVDRERLRRLEAVPAAWQAGGRVAFTLGLDGRERGKDKTAGRV